MTSVNNVDFMKSRNPKLLQPPISSLMAYLREHLDSHFLSSNGHILEPPKDLMLKGGHSKSIWCFSQPPSFSFLGYHFATSKYMFGCMIVLLKVLLAVLAYSFLNMSGFLGRKWWFPRFPEGKFILRKNWLEYARH